MRLKLSIFAGGLLSVVSCAAVAQAPPAPATPPQQTAPPAPSSSGDCAATAPRGATSPEGSTVGRAGKPQGDKLAESEGVLCPPAGVDPEIRAATPETRDTLVKPPPGTPGDSPSVGHVHQK
jgi:hypothetical protein